MNEEEEEKRKAEEKYGEGAGRRIEGEKEEGKRDISIKVLECESRRGPSVGERL